MAVELSVRFPRIQCNMPFYFAVLTVHPLPDYGQLFKSDHGSVRNGYVVALYGL